MEKPENNFIQQQIYSSRSGASSLCHFSSAVWSDGRVDGAAREASIVQKSHITGNYMWLDDYLAHGNAMGVENKPKFYRFHDLQEAYHQFEYIGELEDERCVQLLWEIVRAFNDRYRRHSGTQTKKISPIDSRFYIKCILELLKKGGDSISSFEKMELYREAGMFSKCFKIYESGVRGRSTEVFEELLFRAANGDSSPFVVQSDFY